MFGAAKVQKQLLHELLTTLQEPDSRPNLTNIDFELMESTLKGNGKVYLALCVHCTSAHALTALILL
jgi:hypothetical protein